MIFQVQARDKAGRVFTSEHVTREQAQQSAANCRGRYPYGNRVKVVELDEPDCTPCALHGQLHCPVFSCQPEQR